MKKGIVMEISDEFITMLTPDGEFIKARNHHNNYQIGEEIDFFPVSEQPSKLSKRKKLFKFENKLAWVSSVAVILLLLSFLPNVFEDKVYAYMSIDINPSLEIGLDHELNVISIEALNDDGTNILNTIDDWKNQHVDVITELILEKSRERGYLETGEEVIITTVINDTDQNELELLLRKDLEEISSTYQQEEILITSIESNEETRLKAKNQGISTGKFLQLEKKIIVEKDNNPKDTGVEKEPVDASNNSQKEQLDVEVVNGGEKEKVNQQPEHTSPDEEDEEYEEDDGKKKDKKQQIEQKKQEKKEQISEKKKEQIKKKDEKRQQIKEKKDEKKQQIKEKKNEIREKVKEKKEQQKEKIEEKRNHSKMPEDVRRMLEEKFQEKHFINGIYGNSLFYQ